MNIALLVRGRFVPVEGVKVRQDSSNAWTLTIPLTAASVRDYRRGTELEDWDEAVFSIDEQETAPCVASAASGTSVTVSVWI